MGQWPTTSGGNFIDSSGLVPGGSISFLITANNLRDFTGIEVNIGSDSWTMSNITIAYIESYDKRASYFVPTTSAGATTNFWIERNCISVDILCKQNY